MKPLKYWNSDKVAANYLFELDKKNQIITLGLESLENFSNISPAKKYEFFEGLWESDVVEAFISTGEKSYIEINLSTTGAWWAAAFSDYRKRINSKQSIERKSIELEKVEIEKNKIIGTFSYKKIPFNDNYNVCAILDKKHLSLNSLDKEPDFHLKELRA